MSSSSLSSLPEPRRRIRDFLQHLVAGVGLGLPTGWPTCPPHEIAGLRRTLLDRIAGLYQYIDAQPDIPRTQKAFARFFPETALHLLELDHARSVEAHVVSDEALALLVGRPPAIVQFDQLYCTPDSTERRVRRIVEAIPPGPTTRVLFLGDDDLGSVMLASQIEAEIHVVDLDDRLLDFIGERAPSVVCHKIDLFLGGLPRAMKESFDAVVLDPPWDEDASWLFLAKAILGLKQTSQARIFLSFCPLEMELAGAATARLWQRLAAHGIILEAVERNFNLYDLVATEEDDFQELMKLYLPPVDSSLMTLLREAPYAFAHLYQLRRMEHFEPNPWRQRWLAWWHGSSSSSTISG